MNEQIERLEADLRNAAKAPLRDATAIEIKLGLRIAEAPITAAIVMMALAEACYAGNVGMQPLIAMAALSVSEPLDARRALGVV